MAEAFESLPDAELLRRSRRVPDAFIVVCARHAGPLQGWLRRELGDDLLAQEVLTETLAQAWFASGRFRDNGGGAAPWLHGIARNLVRRLRRDSEIESRARARLRLAVLDHDSYEQVLDRLSALDEFDRVSDGLERLPAEQREALELRVIEELNYAEVGTRLHISTGAARARVFRALTALRAQIGEQR